MEQIKGIHEPHGIATGGIIPRGGAQLLTYMRLAGVKIGFLINFNVTSGGVVNRTSYYTLQVLFVSFVVK
ncbi:MAG: GxxExxY protein [Candidatus Bipolaricaulota bacterium]|nr:GxxExxY protein [Candidatus Bipolaricaulota bacterium]